MINETAACPLNGHAANSNSFDEQTMADSGQLCQRDTAPGFARWPNSRASVSGPALRTLPNSSEAEEHLLSCCLLDGADVVSKCIDAQVTSASFYDHKHGIVFGHILDLFSRRAPIDVSVLREELMAAGQLEQVGGYPFLVQISSKIPTTAQAAYFIERVRERAMLREIIRSATGAIEDCYAFSTGQIDEFAGQIITRIAAVTKKHVSKLSSGEYPWSDLLAFKENIDPDCLMGTRYLGRTGALVIVAPSGVGKSVLSMDLAACSALGRPFFGLKIIKPLRVLYIQAEDDIGDVAEGAKGFIHHHSLKEANVEELKKNLRILRWNDACGEVFLKRLQKEFEKWPFDLVIINPLFSFCGCAVSDQEQMSAFLRNGLNPILNATRAAAVIVHHTNKPIADPKTRPGDANVDLQYAGSGSAELTNWARAAIALQAVTAAEGVFKMRLTKRGKRAGIVDDEGNPTTTVMIEHAKQGLCWVPSSYRVEKGDAGQFKEKFDLARAVALYDPNADWLKVQQAIALDQNVTVRTVRRYRKNIEDMAA